MLNANLVLMILALICFFCASIGRPATPPYSIGWLGAFFAALSLMIR